MAEVVAGLICSGIATLLPPPHKGEGGNLVVIQPYAIHLPQGERKNPQTPSFLRLSQESIPHPDVQKKAVDFLTNIEERISVTSTEMTTWDTLFSYIIPGTGRIEGAVNAV